MPDEFEGIFVKVEVPAEGPINEDELEETIDAPHLGQLS